MREHLNRQNKSGKHEIKGKWRGGGRPREFDIMLTFDSSLLDGKTTKRQVSNRSNQSLDEIISRKTRLSARG
jgi:hypothetical protein